MSDLDLDELRAELDGFRASPKRRADARRARSASSPGFEEIQRFVEKHGRAPQHGEDRDIFERLYAVRLDRLRALEECRVAACAARSSRACLTGAASAPSRAGRGDGR